MPDRLMYQWGYIGWQVGRHESIPARLLGAPCVLRRGIGDASWTTLPVERAWGPFFPSVPEQARRDYFYPVPLSDAVWQGYAQNLDTDLRQATTMMRARQSIVVARPTERPSASWQGARPR
jgi:hypothetical protein